MKRNALAVLLAAAVTVAAPAWAKDPTVEECPSPLAAAAALRCSGVRQIAPATAHALKLAQPQALVLIDVRPAEEVETDGTATDVDFIVPWSLTRLSAFVQQVRADVAARGGNERTPVALLCNAGVRAQRAAHVLQAAGFRRVWVVAGGMEGVADAHGVRHGGWKAAGLPWDAHPDAEPLLLAGAPKAKH
ncbi:MAG: rhodanese-like domain-containing protein [Betaproteobacteria bacterium]